MSGLTKLDMLWNEAIAQQGKELEGMVKRLKLHCIKHGTAHYDDEGNFTLNE